ncbi:homoserine kinase [Marinithermofilum abyssi]|uniref:Homoserine kinase n=1 Tax=Marinithermofilum abyssi TaxID=1571185 RepID=A0A8J2VF33_9BACL|nr:phosphotransferase [Marinithermofilum abyssi]GGE16047.1 homoserine kinase [Marinithermofilum abyssi]
MEAEEQHFLRKSYGWDNSTSFTLIQEGENKTYKVCSSSGNWVLRKYRRNRFDASQIKAELALISTLRPHFPTPSILKNQDGELLTLDVQGSVEQIYAVFQFIKGNTLHLPTAKDYRKLGFLMRRLHDVADQVQKKVAEDWPGWSRPLYDTVTLIEKPLQRLISASFLTEEDRACCIKTAKHIKGQLEQLGLGKRQFVHGDFHFGNILVTHDRWVCLDFDECGWGPRSFDIGTVRLHMRAADHLTKMWPFFSQGYGKKLSEEEIRLGTALRIFYMSGKIPIRQDIEMVRREPAERSYMRFINEEITG